MITKLVIVVDRSSSRSSGRRASVCRPSLALKFAVRLRLPSETRLVPAVLRTRIIALNIELRRAKERCGMRNSIRRVTLLGLALRDDCWTCGRAPSSVSSNKSRAAVRPRRSVWCNKAVRSPVTRHHAGCCRVVVPRGGWAVDAASFRLCVQIRLVACVNHTWSARLRCWNVRPVQPDNLRLSTTSLATLRHHCHSCCRCWQQLVRDDAASVPSVNHTLCKCTPIVSSVCT